MALTPEEARLVAVLRSIRELDRPLLIDTSDVGHVLAYLSDLFDMEAKEQDLTQKELKNLLLGFSAGLAVPNLEIEREINQAQQGQSQVSSSADYGRDPGEDT